MIKKIMKVVITLICWISSGIFAGVAFLSFCMGWWLSTISFWYEIFCIFLTVIFGMVSYGLLKIKLN